MINHYSARWTQLQCDAWASQSRPHDSALRSELNYPSDPCFSPCPLLSSLSAHCQTLPFYTPWSNTVFFYYLSTPFTQPLSKLLQVLLCSMLALGVHIMCWALLPLLGRIQPASACRTPKHFPSHSVEKAADVWDIRRTRSSFGSCFYFWTM